eukprot:7280129-Prymnesium_polylepis.1
MGHRAFPRAFWYSWIAGVITLRHRAQHQAVRTHRGRTPHGHNRMLLRLAWCLLLLNRLTRAASSGDRTEFQYATDLRIQLLTPSDSGVPPTTRRGETVQVGLQVRFFKVLGVDISSGVLTLKVWRRMTWIDSRLSWNESEHGGITSLKIYPGVHTGGSADAIDNNMWTPDVYITNSVRSMRETLDTGAAYVQSSGDVFYTVPGIIEVTCRFSGLVSFPRDKLSCPMEFGSWAYSDQQVNMSFFPDGGAVISGSEETSGTTYQEYTLIRVDESRHSLIYETCCPDESFSLLKYRLYLDRPSNYYFWSIEIVTTVLTAISFVVFWLDATQVSERLGYGITLILAVEVMKIGVQDNLPVCGEMLWAQVLMLINEGFCVLSLLETCVALHLAFAGINSIDEASAERLDFWARRIIPPAYAIAFGT